MIQFGFTLVFNKHYERSDIKTWADTADMSVFSEQVDASLPYPMLWFLCIMWRFFSNGEVWRAFMDIGAVSFHGHWCLSGIE